MAMLASAAFRICGQDSLQVVQERRASAAGIYQRFDVPDDRLSLNADGTFSLLQAGKSYQGTFRIFSGGALSLVIGKNVNKCTLQGNTITDGHGSTWIKMDATPEPSVAKEPRPVSGNEPAQARSKGSVLRNGDVIKMAQAGLDESIIVAKIKASSCEFDTEPDTLIALKTSGVSSAVLKAMTDASVQPQTEPRNRPAASGSGLPASYGGFLFDGTQYQSLAPAKISVVVGLRLRTGGNGFAVDGFSGNPPQSAVPAPSEILVYQQNIDIASVHLARLEFVRSLQAYQFNIATATVNPRPDLYPSLFGVEYNQEVPISLWRPREQGIPVRTEPVVERNGMFRLVPEATLPPGKYALYFGDSIHASGMIFTTPGGAAGTAYYFEVRAATK